MNLLHWLLHIAGIQSHEMTKEHTGRDCSFPTVRAIAIGCISLARGSCNNQEVEKIGRLTAQGPEWNICRPGVLSFLTDVESGPTNEVVVLNIVLKLMNYYISEASFFQIGQGTFTPPHGTESLTTLGQGYRHAVAH